MEKEAIAVGDSTRLEIIFDTKNYSGPVSKRPKIETNEGPPEKYVQISCAINARPDSTYPIIIKPYKLDLTQFGEKVRNEVKFTVENVSDKDVQLTAPSIPEQFLTVNLPKVVKAGKTAEAIVKLKKEATDKEFEKSITLQCNDEKSSRFTIPLKRMIRKPGQDTASAPAATAGH